MSNNVNHTADTPHKPVRHEGPKRHLIAFVASIVFTAFAFAAVILAPESPFVAPFIIVLGIVQALFQLYIWMHMDQKGHEMPATFIYFGFFVAMTAVITFIYWLGGY
jgi:cytochrome c oxidase subunit IV